LVGFALCPESPRFLAGKNRWDEAKRNHKANPTKRIAAQTSWIPMGNRQVQSPLRFEVP
jgi:hypothetical protein